jgi:hypothetical protein
MQYPRKEKTKELQTSGTSIDRVNEKKLDMEYGLKYAPLYVFFYIFG